MNKLIEQVINQCINSHIPFIAYQEEYSDKISFFSNPSHPKSGVHKDVYFSIVEFNTTFKERQCIYFEYDVNGTLDLLKNNYISDKTIYVSTPEQNSTNYNVYINQVQSIINHLKLEDGKIVLSKIYCDKHNITNYYLLVKKYFSAYPNTFRYIYYTPQTGFWIGATPEILLKYNTQTKELKTMSLAGTRLRRENGITWDQKNLEEHEFVTQYISKILLLYNLNTSISPLENVHFGNNIEHLCNKISAINVPSNIIESILDELSPTPALAGFPKQAAINKINSIEQHKRRCYGGYIAIHNNEDISAYVNIRCAQFDKKTYCIYSGGGITKDSNPIEEWKETENKISTLKRVFHETM